MIPKTCATGVPRMLNVPGRIPRPCLRDPRIGPSSPSRIFQLIVRMQEAREERCDDQEQDEVLVPASAERDRVGDGKPDEQRQDGRDPAVQDGVDELLAEFGQRRDIGVPREIDRIASFDGTGRDRIREHLDRRAGHRTPPATGAPAPGEGTAAPARPSPGDRGLGGTRSAPSSSRPSNDQVPDSFANSAFILASSSSDRNWKFFCLATTSGGGKSSGFVSAPGSSALIAASAPTTG